MNQANSGSFLQKDFVSPTVAEVVQINQRLAFRGPGGEIITVVFGQIRQSVMATTCVASIAKEPLCGSP